MSLFSRFFYKRPPDGLLEFTERVYVFDSCFSTEVLPDGIYRIYLQEIVTSLFEEFPDYSFLAFNFREGEKKSLFAEVLSEYDVIIIDYPRQYEGCPLLPFSLIQHLLRVCESWLSLRNHQNIILFHCERGGWPLLAFLLASMLIFRKIQTGEQRTLNMVYREGPKGLLHLLSPLNPFPSQLRYLQYVARRNISIEWPPMERSLSLDCLILHAVPSFDSNNGCIPVIRVFGRNFNNMDGLSTKMLFSLSQKRRSLRHYKQADCDVIKIDIQCLVQGDTVLECLHQDMESEREVMMFRIMFNTAFIRSNILILNSDDLDILWDSKDRFPKGFRAEVLFGDTRSISPHRPPTETLNGEEKGGLPIEAFARVQELFGGIEWLDSNDTTALWFLKHASVNALQEKFEKLILTDGKDLTGIQSNMSEQLSVSSSIDTDEENYESDAVTTEASLDDIKVRDGVEIDSHVEYGHHVFQNHHVRMSDDLSGAINTPLDEVTMENGTRLISSLQTLSPVSVTSMDSEVEPSSNPDLECELNNGVPLLLNLPSPPPPPSLSHPSSIPSEPQGNHSLFNNLPEDVQLFPASFPSLQPTPPALSLIKVPLPYASKKFAHPPPPPPPPPSFSTNKGLLALPSKKPRHPPPAQLPQPPSPPTSYNKGQLDPMTPPDCIGPTNKDLPLTPPPPTPPPPPPIMPPKSSNVLHTTCTVLPPSISSEKLTSLNPTTLPPPSPPSSLDTSAFVGCPPPPPPPPPLRPNKGNAKSLPTPSPPPPPPPPPLLPNSQTIGHNRSPASASATPPPPPPPPPPPKSNKHLLMSTKMPTPGLSPQNSMSKTCPPPVPPPPPSVVPRKVSPAPSCLFSSPVPPPPPPPPLIASSKHHRRDALNIPPPPPPPCSVNQRGPIPAPPLPGLPKKCTNPPPPPPPRVPKPPGSVPPSPPLSSNNQESSQGRIQIPDSITQGTPTPPPPTVSSGKSLVSGKNRGLLSANGTPKKSSLKPLHWVKVTKAMQGSLWEDSLKQETISRAPEIDISELESLFSTAVASDGSSLDKSGARRGSNITKPEIVHLVDMNRSKNCEIMLTKIKMPLQDMLSAILALDSFVLDIDQVENLIKFCPTKEEMVMLKNYTGAKELLGKCEHFFLELMKVPRVESKLRVFAFRIAFKTQVSELRANLNTINDTSREVKDSVKLRQIMQTILTLGNALNQGTARGSAVGFRLDSLLKLSDTRARNNKMTLMHYLCKLLSEKMPELLDFDKDLVHLEAASKIQLKMVAEEMQAVSKGLEKVEQELTESESDGAVSEGFHKALKEFLYTAEAEVRSLILLYSEVGRNADSLAQYFGEDPARCPFEQVTSILVIFVNMFKKSRDENAHQAEVEKRKLEKEASKPKSLKRDGVRH